MHAHLAKHSWKPRQFAEHGCLGDQALGIPEPAGGPVSQGPRASQITKEAEDVVVLPPEPLWQGRPHGVPSKLWSHVPARCEMHGRAAASAVQREGPPPIQE
jgi:hypothetical protein